MAKTTNPINLVRQCAVANVAANIFWEMCNISLPGQIARLNIVGIFQISIMLTLLRLSGHQITI